MAITKLNLMADPWRAPLLPVAMAVTMGIVWDRFTPAALVVYLLLAVLGLVSWLVATRRNAAPLALCCLWSVALALGAAYHCWHRADGSGVTIGQWAGDPPRLVRLRGVLVEAPIYRPPGQSDPLRSFAMAGKSLATLEATAVMEQERWLPVAGSVRLSVAEPLPNLRPGDEIEVVGQLHALDGPSNPGEFDYAAYLRDRHIEAVLVVRHAGQDIQPRRFAPSFAPALAFQEIRVWAERIIHDTISEPRRDLARALLLGEQEALNQDSWDRYQRTGVVHVLAVSGQHLVVLAGFLAVLLRLVQIPSRRIALIVPGVLLAYSLLTGWQPSVERSFFMVGAYYAAFLLQRVVLPANTFALAWLLVCVSDPSAIFYSGCQLSFLAAGVLLWGAASVGRRADDPLCELREQQWPLWRRLLHSGWDSCVTLFLVGALVWLAVSPLVAWHFHLVSPVAVLVGVPVVILTSLALMTGFLMLLVGAICPPLALPFGWATDAALAGTDWFLGRVEHWPLSYWFVPDVALWWLVSFYLLVAAGLILPVLRCRPWQISAALLLWLCVGLSLPLLRMSDGRFRCTFLAVGHGSCVVLELADGRTMLYDAGSLGGPDVTRRQIAPYLWSRGIRRIDEVFLSHADLDHFNGLAALTERFAVGQISCTPSFAERDVAGVNWTLKVLAYKGIPLRVIKAGDRLGAGPVEIQVLHPPPVGPPGKENHRSLVLLVRHMEHTILLTGDLEGPGQDRVLALPPVPVDVMMAPHHGSSAANNPDLARWATAQLVISCQGPPRSAVTRPDPYAPLGATYLTTWREGAVSIESGAGGLVATAFKSGRTWKLR